MAQATTTKAPRRTAKGDLDKLIDWYEQFKPTAGKCIQVDMSAEAMHKMLGRLEAEKPKNGYPSELTYRGRTILALR